MDLHGFYMGTEFQAQDFLGAHLTPTGVVFRTFAPAASRIQLLLDGGGGVREIDLHKAHDSNFWEVEVAGAHEGDHYEFRIHHGGGLTDHADPYGRQMELRPAHRSIICSPSYAWSDQAWMAARTDRHDRPLNIYELNLGSWRKRSGDQPSDDPADWYRYDEVAQPLASYVRDMGYTHVEFMPLNEHPFDGSWGYQPTGYFAPTSRFGTPDQLMFLIDTLHQAGIGCILDIVPVHFATDAYGLADYDGTPLFEYPNDAVGVSEWGSHNFMYSRGESCSFMQSSANMWLADYHFDGLRMDAISRIIYWQGDESRGVNGNALDFLKRMNDGLKRRHPGCLLVAEDSTDFRGTTASTSVGGLGFDYKWDMGWMHDTLELFQMDPLFRGGSYHKLSFSMMYFATERYLLPLSHDEVVHGKGTILQKMWGELDDKFPQARTLYLYQLAHPGKKLSFMGSEVGQLREWDERREQDWFMRDIPTHEAYWHFCRDLNHVYLDHSALWRHDYADDGFVWRDVSSMERSCYAFERTDGANERVLCLLNLSGIDQDDYEVRVPDVSSFRVLMHTDWQRYGGSTPEGSEELYYDGATQTLTARRLPTFSGLLVMLL